MNETAVLPEVGNLNLGDLEIQTLVELRAFAQQLGPAASHI
jgi:hypothetical protein